MSKTKAPAEPFSVYFHPRGSKKKPQLIGELPTSKFPSEYRHDGRVLYFVSADLVDRTATYTDLRPAPAGQR